MNNPNRFLRMALLSILMMSENSVRAESLAVDIRIPDAQGVVVAYLFDHTGDPLKITSAMRTITAQVENHYASIAFIDIPFGEYAVMAYHDKNRNGQLDHNWMRIPEEPLGFSNGFTLGLLSGLPNFEKLRFKFDPMQPSIRINVSKN